MNNQQLAKEYNDAKKMFVSIGKKAHDKGEKCAIYLEELITEIGKLLKLFSFINKLFILQIFPGKRTLNNMDTDKKYKSLFATYEAIKNPPKKPSKKSESPKPSTSNEAATKQLDQEKILDEIFSDVNTNWNVRKF